MLSETEKKENHMEEPQNTKQKNIFKSVIFHFIISAGYYLTENSNNNLYLLHVFIHLLPHGKVKKKIGQK